jgi:hypothetical protein
MKMVVEYLEQAREFEQLADETTDAEVKVRMLEQASGQQTEQAIGEAAR